MDRDGMDRVPKHRSAGLGLKSLTGAASPCHSSLLDCDRTLDANKLR